MSFSCVSSILLKLYALRSHGYFKSALCWYKMDKILGIPDCCMDINFGNPACCTREENRRHIHNVVQNISARWYCNITILTQEHFPPILCHKTIHPLQQLPTARPIITRVQWFSTFFRFYHMVVFHEWDLLVLRPLKKKKKFFAHPTLRASASKISFSKNRRDLKNEYFFLKICRILPNTSKNNRQK